MNAQLLAQLGVTPEQYERAQREAEGREQEKALFALYQQFQALAEIITPHKCQLHMQPDGSGYINFTPLCNSVRWEHLEEAAGKVEAEIKDCQAHLEERRASEISKNDDFDPFIDGVDD